LIETKGIVLVIDVIVIHIRYRKIDIDTGCVTTFLSKEPSNIILKINIKRIPASSGSVGKNISIGKFGNNSLRGTDSGIKNIIPNNNLSSAKKEINRINKITGRTLK
jgi:hypothetical protein